jgi:hypothetical protein
VPLDAGEHQITLRFQPASARLGLVLSLASWLTLALLFCTHIKSYWTKNAN